MNDRERIRDLARQVADIAAEPRMAAVIRRWQDVNALRRPDRPPVWCRPVGAWNELLPEAALQCSDPGLRGLERHFRMILVKRAIGDDTPVYAWIGVGARFVPEPSNIWGVDVARHRPTEEGGAWLYDPPLKTPDDVARLCMPRFQLDRAATNRALAWTNDLLGDILTPRLQADAPLSSTLCTYAAELRGLTPLLMDLMDEPESVHRLMGHLRDGCLNALDAVEASGLLAPNTHDPMICSEPIGLPGPDGLAGFRNMWCMANSQEFDPVSPAQWEEFLLAYQKPIFARFGRIAYGCCENLTHKLDGVLSIPNLRIFVCSAWTDLAKVVEQVRDRHVIMWRQKATDVVHAPDEAALRKPIRDGLRQLQGCHVQIVLRELQTLNGRLNRLHDWSRVAIEEAEKAAEPRGECRPVS
jgi:hypothetical protein